MNEIGKEEALRESRGFSPRVIGVIALALAASVFAQNAVFTDGNAPGYGDSLQSVWEYHASHRGSLTIAAGLEAVNMTLLLLFVTALHGLVVRRGGAGSDWSRLAVASGAVLAVFYGLMIATHITVVLTAGGLTGPSPELGLIWKLHASMWALSMPALGATLVGVSMAAHGSGLTRPWQRVMGLAAGGLSSLAGLANLEIADGSPLIFVGVFSLALWIVWLAATGIRFVRGKAVA